MAGGIAWFSAASLLLPALAITPATVAAGAALPAAVAARFLVGFGEGVALPSMNALVARRVPPQLKATALGSCFAGFHAGGGWGRGRAGTGRGGGACVRACVRALCASWGWSP